MAYAKRDAAGKIEALSLREMEGFAPAEPSEVMAFLSEVSRQALGERTTPPEAFLAESDARMARVVEDLIALLIEHEVFDLEEMPKEARERLAARRISRGEARALKLIAEHEETIRL